MAQVRERKYQNQEQRWRAVCERDKRANGQFFYAVKTTGIFCRPSCGARTPLPENVYYFETITAAESAGYRACKRCKPSQEELAQTNAELIAEACRWMEAEEKPPTLATLAARAGLSPYYFHRLFKTYTGVTPKAYARGQRGKRMREALRNQATVTDAIYEAGYETSSRFYEEMPQRLGMKPAQYRKGGKGQEICQTVVETELGHLLLAATEKGWCFIQFGENQESLTQLFHQHFPNAAQVPPDQAFLNRVEEITSAIARGETPSTELPLDIRGTAFQMKVWEALRKIPVGTTASYSKVAEAMGKPRSIRAVANACGRNPVALTVPCHRVVRADGSLGGYRWGEQRKWELLEREGASS